MRKSQLPLSLCSFGSSDVPMPNARASAVPELPMPNARASVGPEIPICYSGTLQTCTGLQLRYLASPSLSSLHNHTIPDTFKSYYPACSPTITRTAASSPEATPPLPAEPESKPKIRLDYEQQQRAGKVRKTGNARTYRALFATNIPDHTKHEEPEKPPVDPPANIPTTPTQREEEHKVTQTYQRGPRKVFDTGQPSNWPQTAI